MNEKVETMLSKVKAWGKKGVRREGLVALKRGIFFNLWETCIPFVWKETRERSWTWVKVTDEAVIQNAPEGVGFRAYYFETGKDCWQVFVSVGIVMI